MTRSNYPKRISYGKWVYIGPLDALDLCCGKERPNPPRKDGIYCYNGSCPGLVFGKCCFTKPVEERIVHYRELFAHNPDYVEVRK